MEINFSGITDVGRSRSRNEDYIGQAETLNGSLFLVCDGMGGHAGGDIASKTATEVITGVFNREVAKDIPALIYQSFLTANNALLGISSANPDLTGMGTTVVLFLVKNSEVYYGNMGDSRLYFFNGSDFKRLSKDHSFVQLLLDKGIINELEAEIHPRRNEITQALGINETIEPDISKSGFRVRQGDLFMLCSDGLHGMLSDKEMLALIKNREYTVNRKCELLVEKANVAGGNDNISVQLIEVVKPGSDAIAEENNDKNIKSSGSVSTWKILSVILIIIIVISGLILARVYMSNHSMNNTDSISNDSILSGIGGPLIKSGPDSINADKEISKEPESRHENYKGTGNSNKSIKPAYTGEREVQHKAGLINKKDSGLKVVKP